MSQAQSATLTNSRKTTAIEQSQQPAPTKPVKEQYPPRKPASKQAKSSQQQSQPKQVTRRSSKPIINWFQRKLAGTRRSHGASTTDGAVGKSRTGATGGSRPATRVVSSPVPSHNKTQRHSRNSSRQYKTETLPTMRRKTISLNEADDIRYSDSRGDEDSDESIRSSMARESTWSNLEADEDASLRPIPPSGPPSPSPSISSGSYLSHPRTFKSITASTKGTTLLSVDLAPHGVAHIAQVPTAPASQSTRRPAHVRNSSVGTNGIIGSGASITFSALPPSPQESRPSSAQPASPNLANSGALTDTLGSTSVQAPLHTAHHPRNNPRPSSPPMDNASVLTLASSAFGMPVSRPGTSMLGWGSTTASALGADSISQFGSLAGDGDAETASQFIMDNDERERDLGASLRALRPRSSRRGSWDSENSGWSAQIGQPGGPGTPSLARERSLWTTNSMRTGGQFSMDEQSDEEVSRDDDTNEDGFPSDALATSHEPVEAEHAGITALGESLRLSGLEDNTKKHRSSTDSDVPSSPGSAPEGRQSSTETLELPAEDENELSKVQTITSEGKAATITRR